MLVARRHGRLLSRLYVNSPSGEDSAFPSTCRTRGERAGGLYHFASQAWIGIQANLTLLVHRLAIDQVELRDTILLMDKLFPRLPPEILTHYGEGAEQPRLLAGTSRLELTRTQLLLPRFLPRPPARLLDVGGGPGAYAH